LLLQLRQSLFLLSARRGFGTRDLAEALGDALRRVGDPVLRREAMASSARMLDLATGTRTDSVFEHVPRFTLLAHR
jgi:hypothetical protein